MKILAIDPGTKDFGWAYFDPALVACGLHRGPPERGKEALTAIPKPLVVDRLVVELPQIYPRSRSKGDPNDLIALAYSAGIVAGLLSVKTDLVRPRQWKGTIPKTKKLENYIVHRRLLETLLCNGAKEAYESGLSTVPASLRHNVTDAVGLGCWALGIRMKGI